MEHHRHAGRNFVYSAGSVVPRLKVVWLVTIILGLGVVAAVVLVSPATLVGQFTIFVGGAAIGFACSAYFSVRGQFLLRGSTDLVYLVENRPFHLAVYELDDRETINALGVVWHEITHVSEPFARFLLRLAGRGDFDLRNASLYGVRGEASKFAVLFETRYGIPDPGTLWRIWGKKASWTFVDVASLDNWRPGRDLVSVQYWPERDRGTTEPQD